MEKAEELTKVTLVKSNHRHEAMRRSIELLNFNPVRGKEVVNFDQLQPEEPVKDDPSGSHWQDGFLVS